MRSRATLFPNPRGIVHTFVFVTLVVYQFRPLHARKKRMITWVNGIAHRLDHMVEGQVAISKLFGGEPIIYCHNPTAMQNDGDRLGYITDLTQAGSQKLGKTTPEVAALSQHLRSALDTVGPKGVVVHICHSQGALITALALCRSNPLFTPADYQRLELLVVGGATTLQSTPATPFRRVLHYYSINDPLLFLVPSAVQALRSGYQDHDDDGSRFCFLAPRIGDPVADHHLWGPTYAHALQWEGERFQRLYVPVGTRWRRQWQRWLLTTWVLWTRVVVWVYEKWIRPGWMGWKLVWSWIVAGVIHSRWWRRRSGNEYYQPVDAKLLGEV